MPTTREALALAVGHHQAGRWQQAEQLYAQILDVEPSNVDAWHLLGVVARQTGRPQLAIERIQRALALHPGYAAAHQNLGNAFRDVGRLHDAASCYHRAISLAPHVPETHNSLGATLLDQGLHAEAEDCFRRALEMRPDYAEAHNNLGTIHFARGNFQEAAGCYRRAVSYRPDYAEAHFNLANALREQGLRHDASEFYRRALNLNPRFAEACTNLGNVLLDEGKSSEALACFLRAIELKPELAEAHNNLGTTLANQGQPAQAVPCFRRALELRPDYAEAHSNLGAALKNVGELAEAIAHHRRAIELKPESARARSSLLFMLSFCPDYDAAAIHEEHRRWNERHGQPLASCIQPHSNEPLPERRLRIGYVSPDFREHCQALFTVPLLAAHDRERFEIVCYADVARPDAVTERLRSHADVWRDIRGLSDEQLAEHVRNDNIDVLVDLTMHMERSRLLTFARKPAPVQVCWLAYPGTTGLSTMDYRLTDPYLDPPGLFDAYCSEESIRLPDTFWCYDPLTSEPAVNQLPALASGHVTVGSLNNFCKVNLQVLRLWSAVLRAVPRSRLMMLAPEGPHRERVLATLASECIEQERIALIAPRPRLQYLQLYHCIDIGLDTLPYNGHTTSLDAYWMGVPVVTLAGPTVVGRAGISQLTNLGLPELIAHTPEAFVRIAAELAGDLDRVKQLRAGLRQRLERSPLMDAPRFARNIESAYRQIWRRWCQTGVGT